MKKKNKVISCNNLPTKLPVFQTLTCWLVLEKLNASLFLYGVVSTILIIAWIGSIFGIVNEEKIDLFKDK